MAIVERTPAPFRRNAAGFALDVIAVLRKLDGKAAIRRLVLTGQAALDDEPGIQAQRFRASDGDRIEKYGCIGRGHVSAGL